MIRSLFIRFNNKNFNNECESMLSLRAHLIKLYIFLNDYVILYFFFLKCKILILLRVLSRFFFAIRYIFLKRLLRLL